MNFDFHPSLTLFINYAGILAFAMSGALKARSHTMDIFGGAILAFVSAYGGGTIRDILIGRFPVNWINDNYALLLVFVALVIVFLLKETGGRFELVIFITDAVGLGMFTAAGIQLSLQAGINPLYSLALGIITATFGGVVADVLANQTPYIMRKGEFYATACLLGGVAFLATGYVFADNDVAQLVCVIVVLLARIISRRMNLTLPHI